LRAGNPDFLVADISFDRSFEGMAGEFTLIFDSWFLNSLLLQ